MSEQTLLPCPFCGGKAKEQDGGISRFIECENCQACSATHYDRENLVSSWNQRILQPDAQRARAEALEEAAKACNDEAECYNDSGRRFALQRMAHVLRALIQPAPESKDE